jgi:nucleoside-diphosphate-sugar epimerase
VTNRILVTGANGLIGRHVLAPLLASNAEVHACGRAARTVPGVTWHQVDLLARDQVKALIATVAPDIVVHCAWYTEHGLFWAAPVNAEWAAASVALAHEAYARGAKRLVALGTGAEYAPDASSPLSEATSRIGPETLYGSAKDTTRRALEILTSTHDRSFAWARVFMLYGEGEPPGRLVPSISRALVTGQSAKMSSGTPIRDFMEVRDVGAAIAALALSDTRGCVNIGSGEPMQIVQIAKKLAELSGKPNLLAVGAFPDRPNEPPASFPDISRLKKEVGFTSKISLDAGLASALEYWRNRER